MTGEQSTSGSDRYAVADLGAAQLAVRIDGRWCPEQLWYTPDLPVFIAADGSEVDIRDDESILYETPGGAVQELEPASEDSGVTTYEPLSIYPADKIEVWRVDRRPIRSEPADFGGGDSTGVQDL